VPNPFYIARQKILITRPRSWDASRFVIRRQGRQTQTAPCLSKFGAMRTSLSNPAGRPAWQTLTRNGYPLEN
jgi:hypothetical protein